MKKEQIDETLNKLNSYKGNNIWEDVVLKISGIIKTSIDKSGHSFEVKAKSPFNFFYFIDSTGEWEYCPF
jgi:hypothetical protein